MRITVFSDASFCQRTRAAGWGAWAKRDDWRVGQFSGGRIELKSGEVECSQTAELAGIGLALWHHRRQGSFEGVDSVLLQCDSTGTLSLIKQVIPTAGIVASGKAIIGRSSIKAQVAPLILSTIKDALEGKRLALKHVKGHTNRRDGRSWVNDQCDREARGYMLMMRKERDKGLQHESRS